VSFNVFFPAPAKINRVPIFRPIRRRKSEHTSLIRLLELRNAWIDSHELIFADEARAELELVQHDVCRARCNQVQSVAIRLPMSDPACCHFAFDGIAIKDKAGAVLVGIVCERYVTSIPDENLAAFVLVIGPDSGDIGSQTSLAADCQ